MKVLYNLAIPIYGFGLKIASLFNSKAKLFIEGRKGLLSRLADDFKDIKNEVVWMHCASVGEFEQGRPIIEKIKAKNPDIKILLTFFSPSGYELRKDYKMADWVYYLPLDNKKNALSFLKITKPKIAIFIKYEVWPNYFQSMNSLSIPLIMVSAIFREDHRYFRNKWMGNVLKSVDHFFVQDENSMELLNGIGIEDITVSGDTRFDRVFEISQRSEGLPKIDRFKGEDLLLVMGSTWLPDEKLILNFLQNHTQKIKLVIAPHEIGINRIQALKDRFADNALLYSELNEHEKSDVPVLIIDNIGMLSQIYSYANIAYIGGGFGVGIHNILEAATYGIPIVIGPNYQKFKEARELVQIEGAFSVTNQAEFNDIISSMLQNEVARNKTGEICREYVHQNLGATLKIMRYVESIVD